MPSFSKRSEANLSTCHKKLQKLLNFAIKYYDFTVLEGHRTKEKQDEYNANGFSKVKYPNSKHNTLPSKAVDIAPYPIDWNDHDRFRALGNRIIGMGLAMGIKVRWGGDWDGDLSHEDQTFHDLPHIELIDE